MSPTIQARAEAAEKEIFSTDEWFYGRCAGIIARHFANMEKLRAAAERAVNELSWLDSIRPLPAETIDSLNNLRAALLADARALTPDAAADGTKGK